MSEPLNIEARRALVEASRRTLLLYRAAVNDPVSWHIGSRDLQRHYMRMPEVVLDSAGISYPDPLTGVDNAAYENPEAFYKLIAQHNGWKD